MVALFANRDDVGTRRHHLAYERTAEVHDRLQQLALVALDEPLIGAGIEVGVGHFSCLFLIDIAGARGRALALATAAVNQAYAARR